MDTTRRKLLQIALATPLAGLVSKTVLAKTPVKHFSMNTFSVAGFQFYDGPDLILSLRKGHQLSLVAEPDNPHDKYAVKILYKSKMLGYVPKSDNRHISRLLRQKVKLDCQVVNVHPERKLWEMLKVEVCLVG